MAQQKLYTEEQVREVLSNMLLTTKQVESTLEELIPIELPSDEEILHQSDEFELNSRESLGMHLSFEIGAKWMRDKINNQNK